MPIPSDITDELDRRMLTKNAIANASKERLQALLDELLYIDPFASEFMADKLLVTEDKIPAKRASESDEDENDSESEDEDEERVKQPAEVTGSKRLRSRYEYCQNCHVEFDTTTNTKTSCCYHSDTAYPDEDSFEDHDEDCHGPMEDFFDDFPEKFIYECCGKRGDQAGCVINWHLEGGAPKKMRPV
ncbi:hypothetical protein ASPWEDRAFT_40585 [Aspergillus wentii DTO 134E9]|uniref:C2H2-type domain-containing protein n=1 Tax=Aspergillus wentii DTO 134E9 TaxID=1073089 RepID=A0A1L9RKC7_ASPWE|nr:uncharacterized protein ASPWEDRAFT_40585 [Aspergillus wentii DTO 134E9]KAI9924837.1 hypothetical protein MW887_006694 [Aspergillus wentii]OJJ35389.1 hypothetical protein ASPWEDRAFT_40585 [Aspergillus wentii DTO 134E9]